MADLLSDDQITEFKEKGVTVLRGVFTDWVEVLRAGVDANMADPDPNARYPYHLTREGGHNARRIIHADDATGRAVVNTLVSKVAAHPRITQRSDITIVNLLQDADGRCIGAQGVDSAQRVQRLFAHRTILATGGASGLYCHTTTPSPKLLSRKMSAINSKLNSIPPPLSSIRPMTTSMLLKLKSTASKQP